MKEIETDERLGLPSASSLEALSLCPGKFQQEKDLPDTQGPDAIRGERIHAHIAGEITDEDLSEEELETSKIHTDMEANLIADADTVIREERFILRRGLTPIFTGKPDVVAFFEGGKKAVILDHKTGRGTVTGSANNAQLAALAVLVRSEFPKVETAVVGIIQPTAGKPQQAIYDTAAMDAAEEAIRQILDASMSENPPLNPGEKQCRYCRAAKALTCPAFRNQSLALVEENAPATTTKEEIVAKVNSLTGEELASIAKKVGMAKRFLDAVESELESRLIEDPQSVPGFTMEIDKPRITTAEEIWCKAWIAKEGLLTDKGRAKPGAGKLAKKAWGEASESLIRTVPVSRQQWVSIHEAMEVLNVSLDERQLRQVAGKVVAA